MSALSINPPFPVFPDTDGQPLEDGYIWIGTAGLNPLTNPIVVYWDAALTLPAGQPVRTINGFPSRAGTPARLYAGSDYSIQVQNKNGSVTYSSMNATERYSDVVVSSVNAEEVIYDPPFVGGIQTNVEAKLAQIISVKDFGAVGNGSTDDTAAIQAALNAAQPFQTVFFPNGVYIISNELVIGTDNILITGNARINAKAGAQFEYMMKAVSRVNVTIENLKFDANKDLRKATATTRYMGVAFLGCSDCTASNLKVQGCRGYNGIPGVAIAAASQSVRCTIKECVMIDCGDSGNSPTTDADGIFTSGEQNVIIGCVAGNCTDTGFVIESSNQSVISGCTARNCTSGAAITNASASDKFGNIINGLTVWNWDGDGGIVIGAIPTYAGDLLETNVSNVVIIAETGSGFGSGPAMKIVGDVAPNGVTSGVSLSNIRIRGASTQGILVSEAQEVKITDAYIVNTGASCIQFVKGTGHYVGSCQLKGAGTFGITVQNASSAITQGNVFDGVEYGIYAANTATVVSLMNYWQLITVDEILKDVGATIKSIGLSTANAIAVGNAAGSAPVGALVNKFEVYNLNGSPLGYIPVYNL